ncbi:MAG TPA: MFS transporter [Actinomycetes bacterium]|nr:MFS transporter [Actinomycetes bacterium]
MSGGLRAPERRALTIGLVLTVTLVAFESLAVITILPAIKDDLGGLRLYGWVTSAFFLGTLVGIVVAGEQTDRRGPAPPFVAAIMLFATGLIIGGLAPTMLVLVVARGLQGLGAGAITAVTYTSIGRCFPEELRPRILAVTSTAWVVPGIVGPALSALVASHLGWRVVFLGLLPLVVCSASLTVGSLRRIGPPAEPARRSARLVDAVRVAAGSGLLLAGLTRLTGRSPALGVALAVAGVALGLRALLRLLPAGTLRARPGLPVAVLSRGMLTFAFFGADTYVPLTVTAVRGQSTAVGSLAVTAATLSWTAAAWVQERRSRVSSGRRLVVTGLLVLVVGIAGIAATVHPAVPLALGVAAWGVAGFGIGLAYAPISLIVLKEAPAGHEGSAIAAMQLADNLGVALGAGLGGVAVALGDTAGWRPGTGIAIAFAMTACMGLAGVVVARRLPSGVLAGPAPATAPLRPPG